MKKILCYIFICFFTIGNLFNFNVSAKNPPNIRWGDYTYEIENDEISILVYKGNDEHVVFPNEIDGVTVKCIGNRSGIDKMVFGTVALFNEEQRKKVKKITIPEGVEFISDHVFANFDALTEVDIPNTVTHIGEQAFYNCKSLKEITIPESVTTIERDAFYSCDNLTKVTILGTTVGESMFSYLKSLTTVTLGENVVQIEPKAFQACTSLKEITLPENLQTIGYNAFSRTALEQVVIPESVTEISYSAFESCENLQSVIFKNTNSKFMEDSREWYPYEPENNPTFNKCYNLTTFYAPINSQAQLYATNNAKNFVPVAKVEVNGQSVKTDVPPVILNDRVLIPARAIFEALGAQIGWDDTTRTVTAETNGKSVLMQIDNPQINVNGVVKTLDVPPQLLMKRTLVPARAASESFGAQVEWDETRQTVVITYNPNTIHNIFQF